LSIKVLLADDSEVIRSAIVKLLNEEDIRRLASEIRGIVERIHSSDRGK
jgi:Arc/MetJ-type ribon-helix-helix transcriptional regulator